MTEPQHPGADPEREAMFARDADDDYRDANPGGLPVWRCSAGRTLAMGEETDWVHEDDLSVCEHSAQTLVTHGIEYAVVGTPPRTPQQGWQAAASGVREVLDGDDHVPPLLAIAARRFLGAVRREFGA
jgi:hypothetical protein